jgi:hypothetical protein
MALAVLASSSVHAISGWSVVDTPNRGELSNALNGVAVVSDTMAFAAGHSYDTNLAAYRTLVQHWNGSSWRIVSTPNVGRGYNELYGIAAASSQEAWAVGYSMPDAYAPYYPLILRWDGASWRSQTSVAESGKLAAVSALSANDAWAVGFYTDSSGITRPLALHWDGRRWTRSSVSAGASRFASLGGVYARASNDVWAVGNALSGRYVTLIAHWDGARWTTVPSPSAGTKGNRLRAVTGTASNDVWAVGDAQDAGSVILHWNGSSWQLVAHPKVATGYDTLWGLAAAAPNDVWAVGYWNQRGSGIHTRVEHWDGSTWKLVATPDPDVNPAMFGIGAGGQTLFGVGSAGDGSSDRTLALRSKR